MSKSNPYYLGIAGENPALGPPKSVLGPGATLFAPRADFGGPWSGFSPESLRQGLDFLPISTQILEIPRIP